MSTSPQELNTRLLALEKGTDTLLEIKHQQKNHGQIIQQLQIELSKLVELNSRQVEMAVQAQESNRAIERAFGTIERTRIDFTHALKTIDDNWAKWRDKHEAENADTAKFASASRGGLRVLGIIGFVLWALLGWVALDWRATLTSAEATERRDRMDADAALNVRVEALSGQLQEIRIKRELEDQPPRSPHP